MRGDFIVGAVSALFLLGNLVDSSGQTNGPPPFTDDQFSEDYSYLKDPAARTNFFDSVKYIQLNASGDDYLTLGGEFRDRYEYFNDFNFGSGPQDHNGYNLLRLLFNADLHLGPYVRVFVQGISATEQNRTGGPRTTDVDAVDLHQAFLEIHIPFGSDIDLTLRGGRQVITLGSQRLIGVSDFSNIRRVNDAFRGILELPNNTLDFFFARPVRQYAYEFDDDHPDTFFTGFYDTWKLGGIEIAPYLMFDNRDSMTFNKTTAGEDRTTLGLRVNGHLGDFDFDVEPDYQVGRFDGEATHSFSIASEAGYTFKNITCTPRTFFGFDMASGGDASHPGDAFDQLFPSGHDKFGIMDEIGRQNIIAAHPGVHWTLYKEEGTDQDVTLLTQYRQFWRASDQDALYNSGGTVVRTSGSGDSSSIGGELDLQVNWQINRYLETYAGYCHFFHGPFISETGPGHDIDFAYSAVTFTF